MANTYTFEQNKGDCNHQRQTPQPPDRTSPHSSDSQCTEGAYIHPLPFAPRPERGDRSGGALETSLNDSFLRGRFLRTHRLYLDYCSRNRAIHQRLEQRYLCGLCVSRLREEILSAPGLTRHILRRRWKVACLQLLCFRLGVEVKALSFVKRNIKRLPSSLKIINTKFEAYLRG